MPSFYFVKLYDDILDDHKMGHLPDRLWRRTIEFFLLANRERNKESSDNGFLPSISEMAWTLRCSPEEIEANLQELHDLTNSEQRPIVRCVDGRWFVTRFADRQEPVSDAERKRRQRERDRVASHTNHNDSHEPVTSRDTEIEIELDTEIDTNVASDGPDGPKTFQDWQALIEHPPKGSNRQAVLRRMFEALFPNRDPPTYQYLAKVGRQVGGAGRLGELLWQHSTKPPTGDILAYVQGVARKGQNGNAQPKPISIQGHIPRDQTPEEFYGTPTAGEQRQ